MIQISYLSEIWLAMIIPAMKARESQKNGNARARESGVSGVVCCTGYITSDCTTKSA
jgi:hypothetical protein